MNRFAATLPTLALLAFTVMPAVVQASEPMLIAADGRTLARPPEMSVGDTLRVVVRRSADTPSGCRAPRPEAGGYIIKYRFATAPVQPDVLSIDDPSAVANGDEFQIAITGADTQFLIFNVWEGSADASALAALNACVATLRAAVNALAPLQKGVADAQAAMTTAAAAVSATTDEIAAIAADVKAYSGSGSDRAAEQIAELQRRSVVLRGRLVSGS